MTNARPILSRLARMSTSRALKALRRGHRTVLWAPAEGLGFGNFLYLWLHAHVRQAVGDDYRVLTPPPMDPWLCLLPEVAGRLTVTRRDVSLTDRREWAWWSEFGSDFTREDLDAFVRDAIIGSPLVPAGRPDPGLVTLNVRRGNYYSEPHFRKTYGFDIPAYVDMALDRATSTGGRIERILVVSDGLSWCRLELDELLHRSADVVDYVAETDSPQDNFRAVATAQRLVGTNSSFSYWGGYISNVLYGAGSQVVMPRFHARLRDDPSAYQLDPSWEIIEDNPGGWDA